MSGHIRRRGEQSWELKWDVGTDPATGRRRTRYASVKGSKRDAQRELARLIAASVNGHDIEPSSVTVSDFVERWLSTWAAGNVSPKTSERYGELLRKHVAGRIGATRLQKLKPVVIQQLYADLQKDGRGSGKGLAAQTISHVHRVFSRCLKHAVRWQMISDNPAAHVSPPRIEGRELDVLPPKDARKLLAALPGEVLRPIASLALATGMRRGELCALRWQDIDFPRGLLRVEQSLETTKQGLRFKPPKTKYGRRTITLPPIAIAELKAHRAAQSQQRLALGLGKAPPDSLVFARWDGEPRHPDALSKEWSTAAAAVGRPEVTLHSLRHTHASTLIAGGVDVLTISRRLGHGSPAITLGVYGHLFPNTDDRAAQVMEAALAT